MSTPPFLKLDGFTFAELFRAEGLSRLDQAFLAVLEQTNPLWLKNLLLYRENKDAFSAQEKSALLLDCAPVLETFLAQLFKIEEAVAISQATTLSHNPVAAFKKYYVLRQAKKKCAQHETYLPFSELKEWLQSELAKFPLKTEDPELAIALLGNYYLQNPENYAAEIEKLTQWCVKAMMTCEGKQFTQHWTSFRIPERLDYHNLVHTETANIDDYPHKTYAENQWRQRDGFKLTDPRMQPREVQDEAHYCVYCHDHDGDFCSKGFPVKKGDPQQGLKKNPLNVTMTGCPLEEKISEMNLLKSQGFTLAALAVVMIDNPMCPATGHRICNDCMKACIYQKQEPVNIPQVETAVLTDVLALPWGVEIYDLLTRWNPLRQEQWVMKPYNSLKVLIAGMGPAGFTLAHHLLMEGFAVVGFDGLKIEPLPEKFITQPIYHFADLKEALDERVMAGFGGVAEYGITVRWDKNFLKLIYISLMRRPYFQVFGSVRFGGTVRVEDAWEMGFDHFAVAVGAGLPKALPIPGSMAPGMRQANDFLMALQLGNAAKASSLTTLQVRLPAIVIGGGLTGVDTATEVQAYYIVQVEKILDRYEQLVSQQGQAEIDQQFLAADKKILDELLCHGHAVRAERKRAAAANEKPNFVHLIRQWGGVTIAYRRSLQESPAYINNHEELQKAFAEGIYYSEGLEPAAAELDEDGQVRALLCRKRIRNAENEWETTAEEITLPARSILVATGTQPNTAYEFEHRGTFHRLGLQYQHYEDDDGDLTAAHGVQHCKDPAFGPFTSYHKEHYRVSLIGDTHPVFHGSVVKAIASGMRTYPKICHILRDKLGQCGNEKEYQAFANHISHLFDAKVVSITRKTENVVELFIQAPLAAKHFKPGQFYRLQNYETYALRTPDTLLQMEPLSVIGAECHHHTGTLKFLVEENSTQAKLCATLRIGEPVSLMGPTGVRAKIPEFHEKILIMGNATSFPLVQSYGKALRAAGNHVVFLGYFASAKEVYCQEDLEQATDMIIWQTQDKEAISVQREQDVSIANSEDVMTTLLHYAQNKLSAFTPHIAFTDIDRIYVIGNTDLLKRFQAARKTSLKEYLVKDPKIWGYVYGNMQCMLKGVCAQCLQWQIDPETGQRTKAVFACSWPDQPLEIIDIDHMDARRQQNRLLDRLNQCWIDHLFDKNALLRA